jgi:hypothetical protein
VGCNGSNQSVEVRAPVDRGLAREVEVLRPQGSIDPVDHQTHDLLLLDVGEVVDQLDGVHRRSAAR